MPLPRNIKPFIPAKENQWAIRFFGLYSSILIRRVFKNVWLDQQYVPSPERSTLYFGNHHSWWDALTPLLLKNRVLHQKLRAVMEWEQMNRYGFFKRIGCFSIDRQNPRSAVESLNYGIEWLKTPENSLIIYPQGKLENPAKPIKFETGIGWMSQRLPDCTDVVPIIQHAHQMHDAKPSLYIRLCPAIDPALLSGTKEHITQNLQEITRSEFEKLVHISSEKEPGFKKWF